MYLEKFIKTLRTQVHAHHKNFSEEDVQMMTPERLISLCHPYDREGLERQLNKLRNKQKTNQ